MPRYTDAQKEATARYNKKNYDRINVVVPKGKRQIIKDFAASQWDYGPLGVEFKNNVKRAWWKKFVQESRYNVGLDSAIIMNPEAWVASGHVGGFSDPLMDCKGCKARHRADKLIEDYAFANGLSDNPAAWSFEEMAAYIKE